MSLTHSNDRNHLPISFIGLSHFKLIIYLFICLNFDNKFVHRTVHTAPLVNQVNSNPLNQYLREPEIVKVYKEKVVLRIYPLTKKDVRVR